MITINFTLPNIEQAANELLSHCQGHYYFAFQGHMGAGKTTFIKTLCQQLGVHDAVASPTYGLVNEYQIANAPNARDKIYHMDLYRLKNLDEAEDMGLEEYLADSTAWCFIEWPDIATSLLPQEIITIFIRRNEDDSRTISIELP